ncbi:RNA-directed DNA polymerase (Reverse transcriptase) [Trifolium medium]|uniref:RNA-directed DNA polymerase (Reverse transcriptase) n=1 Tax=Trifolium medium TaxID=97028 RepID=A0A392N8P5_9FABA|nr:RNA-directed DNA polymerase (Reverse transcriptase) [Trifolium medium]
MSSCLFVWSNNARSLSRAGKEVLIKYVAQAIPSYCMGAFLLPKTLSEAIERMMTFFYWGSKKDGCRGINWMRWDELTLHKDFGGLGFRNMEAFNLSMLGKQGWKLLIEPNSLLSRILKAKYFPRRDFLEAETLVTIQATLGGAYGVLNLFLPWDIDGRLLTVQKLMYGRCLGYDHSHP